MIRIRRHINFVPTILATLAIVGVSQFVRAQDDVPIDDVQPAPSRTPTRPVYRIESVDQWVFGARPDASDYVRNQLDSILRVRIDEIEVACGLTEAQKRKIHLAGTADIKRFFDRVAELKQKTYDNGTIGAATRPLAAELRSGLFGDGSLYAKTIKKTLSAEQATQLDFAIRQKKLGRYRSTVAWYVATLSANLGLTDDQRQQLIEILVKETRPPTRYTQGVTWYVLFQASEIPESRIKPIFNDMQWKLFGRLLVRARAMDQWLKRNDLVPDDDLAGVGRAGLVGKAIESKKSNHR